MSTLNSINPRNCIHIVEQTQVSSPENFIAQLLEHYPEADYNEALGIIRFNIGMVNTVIRYIKPEEGCHLFHFDNYHPIDAHFQYLPNLASDFYSIVLYFTEERSKLPFYFSTGTESHATDNIGIFFNKFMEANLYVKAPQKAFGIRMELDKDWIKRNITNGILPNGCNISTVLKQQKDVCCYLDVAKYRTTVQEIKELLENSDNALRTLGIKSLNSSLIYAFLTDISTQEALTHAREITPGGELEKALIIINEYVARDFPGIERLASACNLSERTFIANFKNTFHHSPHNYYKKIKMEYALAKLRMGISVKSTAHKAGYKNASSFCRAFRQTYGQSPKSYLRKD